MKKNIIFKIFTLVILLMITKENYSQSISIVKDIATDSSSFINGLTKFKEYVYFNQTDNYNTNTYSLWRTDGTEAGTQKFHNINVNVNLKKINNILYFTDASNGNELWKTDGTEAGTIIIKDINPNGSDNIRLTSIEMNNEIYFRANNGVNGDELWKSDGTEAGTIMIKDVISGTIGSNAYPVATFNNYVYFTADDGTNGNELWKTDGTETGTTIVKDINPTGNSYCQGFFKVGNQLLFTADDGTNGRELWRTDGTTGGTFLVKNINPSTSSGWFSFQTVIGNELFFNTGTGDGALWKSDGTNAGTVKVKDMRCSFMFNYNGTLLFHGDTTTSGVDGELWKSDGTEAGTVRIKDINTSGTSFPESFYIFKDEVYFSADDGFSGNELWKTDGTENGTVLVQNINPNGNADIGYFVTLGNLLLFSADDGSGGELWKYNPCNAPQTNTINTTIDDSFISTSMPSGTLIYSEGTYFDTIRNTIGCDSIIYTVVLTKVSSINSIAFKSLKVFPNPTTGIVNISVNEKLTSIILKDITGKTVRTFKADVSKIDVSNINAGIYFLEVANESKQSIVKLSIKN